MKKATGILGLLLIIGVVGTLLVVLTRDQSDGEIQYTNVYILEGQSNITIDNTQSISSLEEVKFDSNRANSVWIFDNLSLDYSEQNQLLEEGFSIVFFDKESDSLEVIYNGVQKYLASYYYMDANGQLLNGSIYSTLPLRSSLHFVDNLLCNLPTVSDSPNKTKTSHMVSIITELGIYSEVIEAFSVFSDGE